MKAINWVGAVIFLFSLTSCHKTPTATANVKSASDEKLAPKMAAQESAPEPIDLGNYYNAPLTTWLRTTGRGHDLSTMPRGQQVFAGVPFMIEGIIQLLGTTLEEKKELFPRRVDDIAVGRACRKLHFLHSCEWAWLYYELRTVLPAGTKVGSYIVHYADGKTNEIPILHGKDMVDWNEHSPEDPAAAGPRIGWAGVNPFHKKVRVFISTWENPRPSVKINTIDFVSAMTPASPFMLAVTAD